MDIKNKTLNMMMRLSARTHLGLRTGPWSPTPVGLCRPPAHRGAPGLQNSSLRPPQWHFPCPTDESISLNLPNSRALWKLRTKKRHKTKSSESQLRKKSNRSWSGGFSEATRERGARFLSAGRRMKVWYESADLPVCARVCVCRANSPDLPVCSAD